MCESENDGYKIAERVGGGTFKKNRKVYICPTFSLLFIEVNIR